MDCYKCKETIKEGEERELHGKTYCEDCYIDLLSPAKACDPWAVYSAQSFAKVQKLGVQLTETQSRIIQMLKDTGGAAPEAITEKLQMKPSELEREIATLRHMEKVRGELRDGKKIFCLW